jgi:uncharacterized protein (TIGR03067 family)
MRLPLLLVPVLGLIAAADDAPPKGLEKAQGSWVLKGLVVEGKEIKASDLKATLSLKGADYVYTNGDTINKGIYQVDPSKKPMSLDIVCKQGPDKGKTLPAIFEVDGDTMRICLSIKDKERPKDFVSKPESGTVLETWKKAK